VANVYTLVETAGGIYAKTMTLTGGAELRSKGNPGHAWVWACPASGTFTFRDDGNAASGVTRGAALSASDGITSRLGQQGATESSTQNAGAAGDGTSTSGHGGAGGAGGISGAGNAGGAGGTSTTSNPNATGVFSAIAWAILAGGYPHDLNGADIIAGGGGGGGGFGAGGVGTGPGAGGSGGGLELWAVESITNAVNCTVSTKGGAGGNAPGTTFAGGGGGGGGGPQALFYGVSDGTVVQDASGGAAGAPGSISGSIGIAGAVSPNIIFQSWK
jgi:hypothetical protein